MSSRNEDLDIDSKFEMFCVYPLILHYCKKIAIIQVTDSQGL